MFLNAAHLFSFIDESVRITSQRLVWNVTQSLFTHFLSHSHNTSSFAFKPLINIISIASYFVPYQFIVTRNSLPMNDTTTAVHIQEIHWMEAEDHIFLSLCSYSEFSIGICLITLTTTCIKKIRFCFINDVIKITKCRLPPKTNSQIRKIWNEHGFKAQAQKTGLFCLSNCCWTIWIFMYTFCWKSLNKAYRRF